MGMTNLLHICGGWIFWTPITRKHGSTLGSCFLCMIVRWKWEFSTPAFYHKRWFFLDTKSNGHEFEFAIIEFATSFFQKIHNHAKFCTKENGCKEPIIWRKFFGQFSSLDSLKQHSKIYIPDLYPSVLSLDSVTGSGHHE